MRRKVGALVPLEVDICCAAAELGADATDEFHGYQLAKQLAASTGRTTLASYGTLYRALARLVDMGMLTSRWEDPRSAARDARPRRRLYSLSAAGRRAAQEARAAAPAAVSRRVRKGWAPA